MFLKLYSILQQHTFFLLRLKEITLVHEEKSLEKFI